MFDTLRNIVYQGFPPKPTFTEKDIPPGSQVGRVFLVTGGNSGIGFELCRMLYASGARVYMAARSESRAQEAIKKIVEDRDIKPGHGSLKFLHLDLGDLVSVKAAAAAFAQQETRLDVLWNNAGLGANRVGADERSAQGFPIIMAVHCIGTLRFTLLLLPLLQAAAKAEGRGDGQTRIIWTGSGTQDYAIPNGIDPAKFETGLGKRFANYASSKAAIRMLGVELARRYPASQTCVVSIVVDPGNVKSNSWENTPGMILVDALWTHPTVYGTSTQLYAGLSPDFTLESGGTFVQPFGRIEPDEKAYRQDIIKAMTPVEEGGLGYAARLYDWCEAKAMPYV